MAQILFLGPVGTFTHDAARAYFPEAADKQFEPCATPQDVIRKVAELADVYGVVPIENSIQGEVIPTLDTLLFEFSNVFVIGEVSIPITFGFFSISSDAKPKIAISHPHGLAQCKRFIAQNSLTEQTANSTADACRIVAERRDSSFGAIASLSAGPRFGLELCASAIEDFQGAYTRFLILSPQFVAPTGASKNMLAVLPPSASTGVLAELTGAFASRGINIFSIHSRPTKSAPGRYVFILTAEGTLVTGPTRLALESLLDQGYRIKVLGSYPLSAGSSPTAPYPNLPGLLDRKGFDALMPREAVQ